MLPNPSRRWAYAMAVVWVALGALAHLALTPFVGERYPFLPFYVAVGASAWYDGGGGPGLVTLALGCLVAELFVGRAGPARTIVGDLPRIVATTVYLTTGLVMVGFGALLRRRERRAGVAEEEALRSVLALRQEQAQRSAVERDAGEQRELLGLAHAFIRDMGGHIVVWTPGAEALYGYTTEEAVGRASHELLATEFPEPLAAIEARVRAEGSWEGTLVHRTRDGRPVHVASHWTLRRGMFGRSETIVEVNNDVTSAIEAAEERERARREEAAILESVDEGIFGVDLRGRCTFANRVAARMLGWEPEDLAGSDLHETLHGEHAAAACPLARALLHGKRAPVSGDVVRCRDGSEIAVEYSIAPILIGGAVNGTVVAMRDIGERLRQEAAVRASEDRLRLLIESAHDYAIFTVTRDGTIESWNAGAERVYGFSADEAVGRPVAIIFTPEDRARGEPARELRTAEERGAAPDERWHVRKDGSRFFASGVVRPIPDGRPAPRSFVKIAQDVTPRLEAERERERLLAVAEQARREAEEANRAKDDFLAVLSHELRSPLHAMAAWLHILKTATARDRQAQAIATLERSLATQTQLINDLLDVSRIITGKLDLDEDALDLGELARHAVDAARPAAEAKGVELRAECAVGPFTVRGDRKRLAQVLDNLIGNAVKFTPAGGRVAVSVQRVHGDVEVRVTDTGIGMAAALVPHIFERFLQADSSSVRGQGGLGLGLSIVKHLVEHHGGTVRAESPGPGQGSTFTLRLPFAVGGIAAGRPASDQPDRAGFAGVTVLLVEDDADARAALALVLEEHGATVLEAESTDPAVEIHARERPVVVLSDIAMPGRSGYDLIQRVRDREQEGGPRTMAIAMSGFVGRTERERALRAGFDEYVGKPIDPDALMECLRALLARRPAATRART